MKELILSICLIIIAFIFLLKPESIPQNWINFTAFIYIADVIIKTKEDK